MPSSTSHSNFRWARLPALLALLALLAMAASVWIALRWDPEIRYCKFAAGLKQARAEQLHASHTNIIVFYGDSSCSFSVDGDRMLARDGLPVVNFGMAANMGPRFLTAIAIDSVRPGDTLVVALVPSMLLEFGPSGNLAAKTAFAIGRPELISASNLTGEKIHWVREFLKLRLGAYFVSTYAGKILLHRPPYRYLTRDIRPSGQYTTKERMDIADFEGGSAPKLPPDSVAFLTLLKKWGDERHVKVIYTLPWQYASPEKSAALQHFHAQFALEMTKIMPVLRDPALGVCTVRTNFADLSVHLTAEAAIGRSDALSDELRHQSFWSEAELKTFIESGRLAPAN